MLELSLSQAMVESVPESGASAPGRVVMSRLGRVGQGAPAAAPSVQTVLAGGVRLAYTEQGDGPALVCLHAIGHTAADFVEVQRRFSDRFRVIALDWPGHGASDDDREAPTAERYGELLALVVDALGLEPVVLLGNSIGGAAAIRCAALHPDRVRALILENSGGLDPATDRLGRTALRAMAGFFAAGARGAWWYPRAYALYYRMVLQRRAAAVPRARIVAAGRAMAPLLLDAWRGFASPAADLRPLIPQVVCPVLLAWATRDQLIQLRRCRASIRLFPDHRLEKFAAGHAPHLETPGAFCDTLDRFLGQLPE